VCKKGEEEERTGSCGKERFGANPFDVIFMGSCTETRESVLDPELVVGSTE